MSIHLETAHFHLCSVMKLHIYTIKDCGKSEQKFTNLLNLSSYLSSCISFCVFSLSLSFSNPENACLPFHSLLRVPAVHRERRGIFFTSGVQAGSVGQFWTESRISLLLLTYTGSLNTRTHTHKEELVISNGPFP